MAKSSSASHTTFQYIFLLIVVAIFFNLSSYFKLKYQSHNNENQNKMVVSSVKDNNLLLKNTTNVENVKKTNHQVIETNFNTKKTIDKISIYKTENNIYNPERVNIKWSQFISYPKSNALNYPSKAKVPLNDKYNPIICSEEMVRNLKKPRLSKEDFSWCQVIIFVQIIIKYYNDINNNIKLIHYSHIITLIILYFLVGYKFERRSSSSW